LANLRLQLATIEVWNSHGIFKRLDGNGGIIANGQQFSCDLRYQLDILMKSLNEAVSGFNLRVPLAKPAAHTEPKN